MLGVRNRHETGLTLLELLVVVAIMFLLLSVIYNGFRNYVAEQQFQSAVVEVHALISEARQETLGAEGGVAHGVLIESDGLTSLVGPGFSPSNADAVEHGINGVTITPTLTGGTSTIMFARLSGIPSATGTIVIQSNQSDSSTTFTMLGTGLLQ